MNRAVAMTIPPAAGHAWIQAWLADLFAASAWMDDHETVQPSPSLSMDVSDIQASRRGDGDAYARLVKRYSK